MLDEHDAWPEQINARIVAGDFLDGFLETGDGAAFDAEHLEKLIPEGLLFRRFAPDAGPFAGELDGVVAYFIPTDWHGVEDNEGGAGVAI